MAVAGGGVVVPSHRVVPRGILPLDPPLGLPQDLKAGIILIILSGPGALVFGALVGTEPLGTPSQLASAPTGASNTSISYVFLF